MRQIIASIGSATGGWPRRVGNMLFVHEGETIQHLSKPADLFSWLGVKVGRPAKYHRGVGCHTKDETYSALTAMATEYRAIEVFPHEPPVEGHYYGCKQIRPGDGSALQGLLDRYNPATPIDRDLLLALLATPLWGGRGGARPVFVITADSGRGAGKSTAAAHVGLLYGGTLDISPTEEIGKIKQRLLTAESQQKRVVLCDNIKSLKFSWGDLEALVTSPTISGWRIYSGDAGRPNLLTYVLTLNGASLSTDMAQRSVIVKLDRPRHSGTWEQDAREYIDQHRTAIIADLIGFLRSDRFPLDRYTRWGAWERDILERLPEPAEAQRVISERQAAANVETEEGELIEDYFARQLKPLGFDLQGSRIFIPSKLAAEWYSEATNERASVAAVSRMLNQKHQEGGLKYLRPARRSDWGRGFEWTGPTTKPETHTQNAQDEIDHRAEIQWRRP